MAPAPRKTTSPRRTSRGDLTVDQLRKGLVEQAAWIDAKGTKRVVTLSMNGDKFTIHHTTKDLWGVVKTGDLEHERIGPARSHFHRIRKQNP
jgi:hypothetical protein